MSDEYQIVLHGMTLGPLAYDELIRLRLEINTRILSPKLRTWEDACDLPELLPYFEAKGIYFPAKSNLASFWRRLVAYIIDAAIVETGLLLILNDLALKGVINRHSGTQMLMALVAFQIGIIFYNGICEASMKGSIGKKICGLVVVNVDGKKIGLLNALRRNIFKVLSRVILYLGFLRVLWDENRQGWHDEFAKTYVVKKRSRAHVQ